MQYWNIASILFPLWFVKLICFLNREEFTYIISTDLLWMIPLEFFFTEALFVQRFFPFNIIELAHHLCTQWKYHIFSPFPVDSPKIYKHLCLMCSCKSLLCFKLSKNLSSVDKLWEILPSEITCFVVLMNWILVHYVRLLSILVSQYVQVSSSFTTYTKICE